MAKTELDAVRLPSPAQSSLGQSSQPIISLCVWCQQWNWQAIFNRPVDDIERLYDPSMTGQCLGPTQSSRRLEDLLLSDECCLCAIVLEGLAEHAGSSHALASLHGFWLSYCLEPACAPYDSGSYYYREWKNYFLNIYRLRVDVLNTPIHCRIQKYIGEAETPAQKILCGRKMQDVVNDSLLSSWLELCDEKHDCMSQTTSLGTYTQATIWMIDVRQAMIVPWMGDEATKPYAALSYVWGDAKTSQLKHGVSNGNAELFKKPGGIFQAEEEVPLTIRDAMELCRRLHLHYLWVDSICICQDRPAAEELASMSYIYGHAYVTIACVDGDSSWSGLPGVRVGSRSPSSGVREVDGVQLGLARRPVSKIQGGIWNTRAWTYQEFVLSRRVLYFASDEVVFCCNNNVQWRESMHLEALLSPNDVKTPGLHAHFTIPKYTQLSSNQTGNIASCKPKACVTTSEYEVHLRQFVSRNTTRLQDRTRAFQGIIDTYKPLLGDLWLYGLPIKGFNQALTFKYEVPMSADPERLFPTWCWAHWHGITEFGYWTSSAHKIFARTIFYRLQTLCPLETDETKVMAMMQAVEGHDDERARELAGANTLQQFTWVLPRTARTEYDLSRMLIFHTQTVNILVARHSEGPTDDAPYQYFDIVDTRFPRNAFRDASTRICLNAHWRSQQSDRLEFVMICGQQMAGLSRARNFVVAFLIDTDEHDVSRRVHMIHVREDVWNATEPDWRWVRLC